MKNFAFSLFISLSMALNSFAGVAPAKSAFSPVEDREAVSSASQLRAFAKAAEVELAGLPNHTSLDEVTARVQQLALDYDVKLTSDLETNIEILRDAGLIDQVQEQQVRNLSEYLEQNGEKDITLADLKSQSLEGTQVAAMDEFTLGFVIPILWIYPIVEAVKSKYRNILTVLGKNKEKEIEDPDCKVLRAAQEFYEENAVNSTTASGRETSIGAATYNNYSYEMHKCAETP